MSDDCASEGLEPIAKMLARVGHELDMAVAVIHGLEDVVGHAISTARSVREIRITELQELDHVRQKIEGSAAFLKALAAGLPEDWLIDPYRATGEIGMSALARRLAGGPSRPAQPEELIELF